MNMPGREEYLLLSRKYNLIPVSREINADLDTPISVYKKIAPTGPSFLLESVEGGQNLARYSFIGFDPLLTISSRGEETVVLRDGGELVLNGPPLENLERVLTSFHVPPQPGLPRFFGGAVGYISYDAVRYVEKIEMARRSVPDLPECSFMIAGTVLIFDHVKRVLTIVVNSIPGDSPEDAYDRAEELIAGVARAVAGGIPGRPEGRPGEQAGGPIEANIGREDYMRQVERAREYIKAGDILQVVLSRRLRVPFRGEPFEVYRRLRSLNPSPYLYFLDFGEVKVVGSSPEMLVRVEEGVAQTCPIAGTRPRGATPAEDEEMAADLLQDEKERAEHLMLVDLGRNDLGKVCRKGSVILTRFMEIEKFSHVIHLVSQVQGKLAPGKSCFDALRACFPAGTVSGAPKVRAMEIISELEPDGRGIYAGAIGYFGFMGSMDTAIAIRTVVIHGDSAYVQAGAGIVADSDPAREYEESMNKAGALLRTLEVIS